MTSCLCKQNFDSDGNRTSSKFEVEGPRLFEHLGPEGNSHLQRSGNKCNDLNPTRQLTNRRCSFIVHLPSRLSRFRKVLRVIADEETTIMTSLRIPTITTRFFSEESFSFVRLLGRSGSGPRTQREQRGRSDLECGGGDAIGLGQSVRDRGDGSSRAAGEGAGAATK